MNEPLYEITSELIVLNKLDESEISDNSSGEGKERLEQFRDALDHLNMKFVDKVTDIVKFIRNLEAQRDALAGEAKRLSERKRSFDNRIDWLKNYIKVSMEASGSEKIKYALFTIYVAQSQSGVDVKNMDELDEQFLKIKVEVDKAKILEHVKATGVIPKGVEILRGTHLVIR